MRMAAPSVLCSLPTSGPYCVVPVFVKDSEKIIPALLPSALES